ncbi:MAG: hypothetical protein RL154_1499 [Pseudomonadota bacterium]
MEFKLQANSSLARAGEINFGDIKVQTPAFMPVGTVGSVKALDYQDIEDIGYKLSLGNTYHLYLRPGDKKIAALGGLKKFTTYSGAFLTDSGGFQAFSLSSGTKTTDEGVRFTSHIDGSKHLFTPESVLDIEYNLGSNIMMVLDDLIALPAEPKRMQTAVERTTEWARRSLVYHRQKRKDGVGLHQNIFAIVQGGTDEAMRTLSAKGLTSIEVDGESFDGFAIGGLSVGEAPSEMYKTLDFTTPLLPIDKPRYLMGVGTPQDLLEGVLRGIDMFDCVLPTRNARNGTLFSRTGRINIKGAKFLMDERPLDGNCRCLACRRYSRAYLCHLFRAKELTYFRLASLHNLTYYYDLMQGAREAILKDEYAKYKKDVEDGWNSEAV